MKKRRTFWDDESIGPKLDDIPENERSTIIRMALRAWFGVKPCKTMDDTVSTAVTQCKTAEDAITQEIDTTEFRSKRRSKFSELVRKAQN